MLATELYRWSIKKQLIFLVLAPLLLITLLYTAHSVHQAIRATHIELGYIGSHTANTAASLAELAMFAGNLHDLDILGKAAIESDHIDAIAFLDQDKKIVSLTRRHPETTSINRQLAGITEPLRVKNLWYFSAPIKLTGIAFRDFSDPSTTSPENVTEQVIGWTILAVNEDRLIERRWSTITASLVLTGAATLIAGLLAWLLANDISRSLVNIIATVKKLINGDFQARVPKRSSGEMGTLEQGINELAYRAGKSQQALTQDVSRATQKLRNAMINLEAQNTALTTAKEEAEIASQAKDMFLARMSHELRTPLTTVLGFSKLLKKTDQNHDQAEHTRVIMQASTLLLSIIDDILEFSRLQSSAIVLEQIDFDLEDCLDEVIALHSFSAHEKNLELVLLIESEVPLKLRADKLRIQQMLSNLVSNAIKFTPRGHVVVLASLTEERAKDVSLELSVIDSGEGICEKNLNHLFQPFVQADTSISRRHGGTGLGLVIVKSFAELMQGAVRIESEPGKGTEVVLSIRCDKQSSPPLPENTITPPMLNTLIVYDQNAWVRRSLRNRLRIFSDHIFVANNQTLLTALLRQHANSCQLVIIGLQAQECVANKLEALLSGIRKTYSGTLMIMAGHSNMAKIIDDSLQQAMQPVICLSKPIAGRNLYAAIAECVPGTEIMTHTRGEHQAKPDENLPVALKNSLEGLDILIVEDNEFNLQLIRTILETEGAYTWAATDGLKALEVCTKTTFDLIIMDVHLPLIDGIEASRRIRRNGPNRDTPIIALTANVVNTEEEALMNAGVLCICYKPIDEQRLIITILHAVKREDDILSVEDEPIIAIGQKTLVAEIRRLIQLLESTLPESNWISVKEISHQLRGLTGLTQLQHTLQITRDLDNAAQAKDRDAVKAQLLLLKATISE